MGVVEGCGWLLWGWLKVVGGCCGGGCGGSCGWLLWGWLKVVVVVGVVEGCGWLLWGWLKVVVVVGVVEGCGCCGGG